MYLTSNMKRNLIIGGLVLLALIVVGSVIGTIISLVVILLRGIISLIVFTFESIFNLLLVGVLGYLAYRWYKGRTRVIDVTDDERRE